MKRMTMTMTMGAVAAAAITGLADAAIILFQSEADFNAALFFAGKISKGIENFEQTLLAPGNAAFLNDPLNINNLQGLFNSGDFIDNLTFQSNLDGPGVNGLNPLGVNGLALLGTGFDGALNVGLVVSFGTGSLDILSGPPAGGNHTALGMNVFTAGGFDENANVEVRVFDKNEQQVGFVTLGQVSAFGQFLGILATDGDTIGRVNIWDLSSNKSVGVYDVQTYLIPAPSALALLGLAGLFGPRRRRR